ncbi:MAG: transcription termination/antitermination protein NusA [Eubacteriaceae bacterium]|nr:transcription termination/antitermination protein NusA [Eubacteriaceae bacterium]
MNAEFIRALDVIQEEKSIDKEELIQAIEVAQVFTMQEIVEVPENDQNEISLEKAREFDPTFELGDFYRKEVRPKDFGRIAAQNAKQLIIQRIKEAERNIIFNTFLEKQDEVLTGIVKRMDKGIVYVDIGKLEAAMLPSEQAVGEEYVMNQRLKVYILAVKKTTKGTQVNVSRTHPGLIKRLFESEVPEIFEGLVDIISISREAGSRTKIAVKANNEEIDPVGACVGQKGMRVQNIINELNGEKIDVIKYSDDIEEYLTNSLSPAKVLRIIPNKDEKTAIAVVDDYQLSLAIGKEGQNVRLAAKLTSWKIDIKSQSTFDESTIPEVQVSEPIPHFEDVLDDVLSDLEIEEVDYNDVFEDDVFTDDLLEEIKDDLDTL